MARSVVSIGDLRERIAVQRVSNTRDAIGGLTESWSEIASAYAKVEPASSGEQFRRSQIQASADWTVTTRYNNAWKPADRIVWRSRTFEIVGLKNDDERRRFLQIACKELSVGPTLIQSYGNVTFDSTTAPGFDSTNTWTMDSAA